MAGGVHLEFTLLLTNRTSPFKARPGPKRKFHLPTIIFRRTVSFREGNIPWRHLRWPLRMSLLSKSWKGSYPTGSHWQTFKKLENWLDGIYFHFKIFTQRVQVGIPIQQKTCRTRESNYSNHGTKTWILQSGITLYLFLSVEYFGRISITFNQPRFDKQSHSLPKMWLVMPQTIVTKCCQNLRKPLPVKRGGSEGVKFRIPWWWRLHPGGSFDIMWDITNI